MTPRQAEVFEFVNQRQRSTGVCPSQEEIAAHLGLRSTSGIRQHLRLIAKKGYLALSPRNPRAIRLTVKRRQGNAKRSRKEIAVKKIPLLGRIPAGQPLNADQETEVVLQVSSELFRGQHLFALRVRGDSMVGAGILNGDLAILNYQPEIENGQIAAVLIDDDATLKRVLRSEGKVVLRAENPNYADIVIHESEGKAVKIVGALKGVIRTS